MGTQLALRLCCGFCMRTLTKKSNWIQLEFQLEFRIPIGIPIGCNRNKIPVGILIRIPIRIPIGDSIGNPIGRNSNRNTNKNSTQLQGLSKERALRNRLYFYNSNTFLVTCMLNNS